MNQPVEVCVSSCETYEYNTVRAALAEQFRLLKAEEVIRPGMRVAVKPNLVVRSAPEEGAVTHPVVICAVVSLLRELGASVVIAESPRRTVHTCSAEEHLRALRLCLCGRIRGRAEP